MKSPNLPLDAAIRGIEPRLLTNERAVAVAQATATFVESELANIVSDLEDMEEALSADITAEEGARIAADDALAADLAAEAVTRASDDSDIIADLATESMNRAADDGVLTANLAAEVANRIGGDATISVNLATETSNRTAADAVLTSDLADEVSARTAADAAIQADLDQRGKGIMLIGPTNAGITNAAAVVLKAWTVDQADAGYSVDAGGYITAPAGKYAFAFNGTSTPSANTMTARFQVDLETTPGSNTWTAKYRVNTSAYVNNGFRMSGSITATFTIVTGQRIRVNATRTAGSGSFSMATDATQLTLTRIR